MPRENAAPAGKKIQKFVSIATSDSISVGASANTPGNTRISEPIGATFFTYWKYASPPDVRIPKTSPERITLLSLSSSSARHCQRSLGLSRVSPVGRIESLPPYESVLGCATRFHRQHDDFASGSTGTLNRP